MDIHRIINLPFGSFARKKAPDDHSSADLEFPPVRPIAANLRSLSWHPRKFQELTRNKLSLNLHAATAGPSQPIYGPIGGQHEQGGSSLGDHRFDVVH
jgi:hypothetical protein